jgi:CheY-like chemotaxis protein
MGAHTILVIDDDPDFVETTKSILETKQYNVNVAYNADEGFAKLEEEIPDAIILDVMMGNRAEGFIFARKIKEDTRFNKIPILVMTSITEQTGFDFPGEPIHPKFFPIDKFMEKPVEPQVLLEEIGRLIAEKNAS